MHTRLRFKFETKILNERLAAKPLSTLFLSSLSLFWLFFRLT
jgi:hypothetical protein